jgi:hypothetical protein
MFKFQIPLNFDQMLSRMPECYYHAVLTSDPLTIDSCASGLLLTWFDEAPNKRSIESIVELALAQISWEICAQGFDY